MRRLPDRSLSALKCFCLSVCSMVRIGADLRGTPWSNMRKVGGIIKLTYLVSVDQSKECNREVEKTVQIV